MGMIHSCFLKPIKLSQVYHYNEFIFKSLLQTFVAFNSSILMRLSGLKQGFISPSHSYFLHDWRIF